MDFQVDQGLPYLEYYQDRGFDVITSPTGMGNGDMNDGTPNFARFEANIALHGKRCKGEWSGARNDHERPGTTCRLKCLSNADSDRTGGGLETRHKKLERVDQIAPDRRPRPD